MENSELEKEAKRLEAQYHREWRKKNPDKVKAINKRYWLKRLKKQKKKRRINYASIYSKRSRKLLKLFRFKY